MALDPFKELQKAWKAGLPAESAQTHHVSVNLPSTDAAASALPANLFRNWCHSWCHAVPWFPIMFKQDVTYHCR